MPSTNTQQPDLTAEQIELGKIYAWIHQRAEFLRARQNDADTVPQIQSQSTPLTAKSSTGEMK